MYFSGVRSTDFPEKYCGTTCRSNLCTVLGENQSAITEQNQQKLYFPVFTDTNVLHVKPLNILVETFLSKKQHDRLLPKQNQQEIYLKRHQRCTCKT